MKQRDKSQLYNSPLFSREWLVELALLRVLQSIGCCFIPKLKEAKQPESYVMFICLENKTLTIAPLSYFSA